MALTKVTGDFIKDGVLTQAHLHTSHGITTAHIGEGSNLYFTNARVDSRIGDLSTSNLSEGSNLYYTNARARAAISVSGNALSYNSSTGVITSNFEESPTFTGAVVGASFSAAGGFLNGSNGGIRIHSSGTKFFNITAANAARDGVMDIGASDARFKDLYLSGNITAGGNITASSGTGHFSVVNSSGYQLNGTYVMDSSRNLVNIAAITASGDIVAPGIYVGSANTSYDFYNNGTSYLNGTVTVDADLNFTAGDFNIGGVRIVGDNDSADQGTAFIRSNGDYLVMTAADGEHVYLNWDSSNGGSGHVYIDNALYAQIFYDRNDTSYFVNPASNSTLLEASIGTTAGVPGGYRLNIGGHIHMNNKEINYVTQLHFNDNVRLYDNGDDSYLNFKYGDTNYGAIRFFQGGGTLKGYFYSDSSGIGILPPDGSWGVRVTNDLVEAYHSHRAPLYYDSSDTSFYLDPANGDRALKTYGSVSIGTVGHLGLGDSSHPKVVYPGKEASWDGSGTTTGAVVITLPGTLNDYDMMYMEIDVYEYSGDNASKIIIGGHNWNSGGTSNTSTLMWYNTGVKVIGSFNKPIYFGWRNDGTSNRRVIVLGETNSSWSYGTVHVSKVSGACYYTDSIDYMGDWVVAQTTSGSYYTKSPTTNHNSTSSPTLITYGSVRGSVFYDINNTSYYLDPNSTTSLRTVGSWRADSSTWDGEFNGKIQHHGSYWYMQSANGVLVRNSSGANNIQLSATGVGTASNDWRAPYFYDSADTSYYLDPAGTSQTRAISIMQGSGLNLYQSGNGSYAYQDARAEGSYSAVYKGTNNGSAYGAYREYWYDGDSYHSLQISGNRWYFNAPLSVTNDVRAPIFYDSDDTNYYFQGNGTSYLHSIWCRGAAANTAPRWDTSFHVAQSQHFYGHTNSQTIYHGEAGNTYQFPGSGGVRSQIFYDYNNTGYYIHADATSFISSLTMNGNIEIRRTDPTVYFRDTDHNSAMIHVNSNLFYILRGGNDTTTWTQVGGNWPLTIDLTNNNATFGGNVIAVNDMRAPIFYDSNNTGFYIDGAGTSRLDSIMLRSTINFPTNSPGVTHGSSHRPAYGIYQEGGAWSHPFPDLCIAMHTGIKFGANQSYNGMRFYDDYTMSTQVMSVNNGSDGVGSGNVYVNNSLQADSSLRSPIFYDSNNTTYYTNPAGVSLMSVIQVGASGYSNIWLGGQSGNYFRFHTNNSHTYFDGNVGDIHWRQGSSTRFIFYMTTANMTVNGTVTQNSDERIKENIITIDGALNKVNQLRGVYYNRTDINTSQKQIGLIAQEVENVIPEAVLTANDELGTKSISYGQINALLIEAIKEQQTIIDDLKSRIETLENQ